MAEQPNGSEYRSHVGPSARYDLMGAIQFNLLTALGLREDHYLLDIGCGSLRAGRLFIPYLLPGRYFGIEPDDAILAQGIEREIGHDAIRIKQARFDHNSDFNLSVFGETFDFVMAQSIFSHAHQAQVRQCLTEAKNVLKPTGVFTATYLRGTANYTGDAWVYPKCVKYTFDFMIELARDAGLTCISLDWYHPHDQSWLMFHHPDHAAELPIQDVRVVQQKDKELAALQRRADELEQLLVGCRQRIHQLEHHPYVRAGLGLNRAIRRILGR
jgi:SAM-dependent methyltransferase